MQDVPLPNGEKIRAGAIILGRILDVTPATPGNQAALILTFDTLIDHGKKIPITTSLRALASPFEIDSAQIPDMGAGESDVYDWLPTTQIGERPPMVWEAPSPGATQSSDASWATVFSST